MAVYISVILTCSFQIAAILILFFSFICSAAHAHSHGNFTSDMQMHIWPYYMLITFLVILTYSLEMAAI